MKTNLKILLFHFVIWSLPIELNGQKLDAKLTLIGRSYADSIVLRWIPENASIWNHAKNKGYIISKAVYINESLEDIPKMNFVAIEGNPINRWPREKVTALMASLNSNKNEKNIQMSYLAYDLSEPDAPESSNLNYMNNVFQDGLNSLKEEKSKLERRFLLAMLPCEQSKLAAEITGYRITDRNCDSGLTYIYKIELAEPHPTYDVRPAYLKIKSDPFNPNIYRSKIFVNEGHEELSFSWKDLPFISSYHVDKSLDGINYERITKNPIGNTGTPNFIGEEYSSYNEDSLEIDKTYYYKFYAFTPFADLLEFGYAEGTPKDLKPPKRPFIDSLVHFERNKVMIHWNNSDYVNENLKGFIIGRADSDSTSFYKIHEEIIPPNRTSFQDAYFDEGSSNYYMLSVVDQNDNISYSSPQLLVLRDEYPPEPPITVKGVMDSIGVVTLTLELQKERDFMGYRVYKSNAEDHEYSVVTETWNDTLLINPRGTIIRDSSTVETLTKFIYYKVTALDYHYNESFFSEVIKVPRPDKIPPVAPLISAYEVFHDKVDIEITASTSNDVAQNYIYRKLEGAENWEILDSIGLQNKMYTDTTVQSKVAYEYILNAKDESGLFSEYGNRIRVKTSFKARPLDMNISCSYYEENEMTLIIWQLNEEINEDLKFIIRQPDSEDSFIVRTDVLAPNVYVYKSKVPPTSIAIIGVTPTKEFLPTNAKNIDVKNSNIIENLNYKTYEEYYRK